MAVHKEPRMRDRARLSFGILLAAVTAASLFTRSASAQQPAEPAPPPPGYAPPPPGYSTAPPAYGAPPPGYGYGVPGQPMPYPAQALGPKTMEYEEGDPFPAGYH